MNAYAALLVGIIASGARAECHAQSKTWRADCTTCKIDVKTIVELHDSRMGGEYFTLQTDSRGRYWYFDPMTGQPLVFSPEGVVLSDLGRAGDGPGELRRPMFMWNIPGDSTAVVQIGKLTVFDSKLRPVRSVRLDFRGDLWDGLAMHWPDNVILNGTFAGRTEARLPFHSIAVGPAEARVTHSFLVSGVAPAVQGSAAFKSRAYMTRSRRGFWTIPADRFVLSEIDAAGRSLRHIVMSPPGMTAPSEWRNSDRTTPPDPRIIGLSSDSDGHLWVFTSVPARNYKAAWEKPVRHGNSGESRSSDLDKNLLFDTRIDVVDEQTGRLISTKVIAGRVYMALPDASMVVVGESADGEPILVIQKLKVANRR